MQRDPTEILKQIREGTYKFYDCGGHHDETILAVIKNLDARLQNIERRHDVKEGV